MFQKRDRTNFAKDDESTWVEDNEDNTKYQELAEEIKNWCQKRQRKCWQSQIPAQETQTLLHKNHFITSFCMLTSEQKLIFSNIINILES